MEGKEKSENVGGLKKSVDWPCVAQQDACHQSWEPEFCPQYFVVEREWLPTSCPLTSHEPHNLKKCIYRYIKWGWEGRRKI